MKTRNKIAVSLTLLLLVSLCHAFFVAHNSFVNAQETVNLNELLLNKWDDYLAWITRYTDITNTTIVDPHDFSSGLTCRAAPLIIDTLIDMYNQTNNEYYLALTRTWVDALIASSDSYVPPNPAVSGHPTIFYATCYNDSAGQSPDSGAMSTFAAAYATWKLYEITGEQKYKDLCDRVAHESADHLRVYQNSTDMALSCAYYRTRTYDGAESGVNRMMSAAPFYAEYGLHVNSTFTTLVTRLTNWVWRSQKANGGLGYDISAPASHPEYTAYTVNFALKAVRINPAIYNSTYITKIRNSLTFLLKTTYGANTYYNFEPDLSAVLGIAQNLTDYQEYQNDTITKALYYHTISSMHFTDDGHCQSYSFDSTGFRWSQHFLTGFFGNYPLESPIYDPLSYLGIYSTAGSAGNARMAGFSGEWRESVTTFIKYGDSFGVGLAGTGGWGFRMGTGARIAIGSPNSYARYNETHYVKTYSHYTTQQRDVNAYYYPSGLAVGVITGTAASKPSEFYVANTNNWYLMVSNGTIYKVNSFTTNTWYTLGTYIMVFRNLTETWHGSPTIMFKSPSTQWCHTLSTYRYFNTTAYEYTFYVATMQQWSREEADGGIWNQTLAWNAMKSLIDSAAVAQPIEYDSMWNTYQNLITTYRPDHSWSNGYKTANNGSVRLIGHNKPQSVQILNWTSTSHQLRFTISATVNSTSITKVYLGSSGNALDINGETSYAYNSSTKIATITVNHDIAEKEVILAWYPSGDINYDLKVDVGDLFLFGGSFGSSSGEPNYVRAADLNNNGNIDSEDLALFSPNYGKH